MKFLAFLKRNNFPPAHIVALTLATALLGGCARTSPGSPPYSHRLENGSVQILDAAGFPMIRIYGYFGGESHVVVVPDTYFVTDEETGETEAEPGYRYEWGRRDHIAYFSSNGGILAVRRVRWSQIEEPNQPGSDSITLYDTRGQVLVSLASDGLTDPEHFMRQGQDTDAIFALEGRMVSMNRNGLVQTWKFGTGIVWEDTEGQVEPGTHRVSPNGEYLLYAVTGRGPEYGADGFGRELRIVRLGDGTVCQYAAPHRVPPRSYQASTRWYGPVLALLDDGAIEVDLILNPEVADQPGYWEAKQGEPREGDDPVRSKRVRLPFRAGRHTL